MSGVAAAVTAASITCAQNVPSYDFQWATIGDVGNPAYLNGPSWSPTLGRGSVGYEYRISKLEVTTAQWMEFVNTFATQSDDLTQFGNPSFWGATIDPDYDGPGRRYVLQSGLPSAGLVPVGGIDWRTSAMYCNWLHNQKSTDLASTTYGAYDTSTFTRNPDGTFNDQTAPSPGAKFWIPSLDEWMKAAYFDAGRYLQGDIGWLDFPQGSYQVPVPGAPWDDGATTSGGYNPPGFDELYFPVGSYTEAVSPWGLWDLSGGYSEWLGEWGDAAQHLDRLTKGSWASCGYVTMFYEDAVWMVNGHDPRYVGFMTVRVASAIPAPGAVLTAISVASFSMVQRRRG